MRPFAFTFDDHAGPVLALESASEEHLKRPEFLGVFAGFRANRVHACDVATGDFYYMTHIERKSQ